MKCNRYVKITLKLKMTKIIPRPPPPSPPPPQYHNNWSTLRHVLHTLLPASGQPCDGHVFLRALLSSQSHGAPRPRGTSPSRPDRAQRPGLIGPCRQAGPLVPAGFSSRRALTSSPPTDRGNAGGGGEGGGGGGGGARRVAEAQIRRRRSD